MSKRLFVGNLSYNTTETELVNAFAPYGATSAVIPTDFDGRAKGFGFVDVNDDQMNAAISALNGKDLGGRTLSVNEARPKPERTGGDRGGYGGGGYGGGGGRGGSRGGDRGGYGGGGNRW